MCVCVYLDSYIYIYIQYTCRSRNFAHNWAHPPRKARRFLCTCSKLSSVSVYCVCVRERERDKAREARRFVCTRSELPFVGVLCMCVRDQVR